MKTIKFEQGARVSIHLYYIVIIDIKQTVRHMSNYLFFKLCNVIL